MTKIDYTNGAEICNNFWCFDICSKLYTFNGHVFNTFIKESQFERQECINDVFDVKLRQNICLTLENERTEILMADGGPDSCGRQNVGLK